VSGISDFSLLYREKLILLSPVSVSEWGNIGLGFLNGGIGKLMFYR
jgi:hypothetical protein